VSEYDREASIMRGPGPHWGLLRHVKKQQQLEDGVTKKAETRS
jgi:hypothetical protein